MDEFENKNEKISENSLMKVDQPDTDEEISDDEQDYQDSEEENASQNDLAIPLNPSQSLQNLEILDDSIPNSLLENMEKALKQLVKDSNEEAIKNFEQFSADYDKMKVIFMESRQQTRNLAKRATEMSSELAESAIKVKGIIKANQADRNQLNTIKKELKKAWKVVESNKERDAKAKDLISNLKNEVAALRNGDITIQSDLNSANTIGNMGKNKLLSLQIEQDEQLKKLTKSKIELEAEIVRNQNEIKSLRADLEEKGSKVESVNKERSYVEEEMVTIKEYLTAKKAEHDREIRLRERVELNLKQTTEVLEKRDAEVRAKNEEVKALKETLHKAETMLLGEKARSEKMTAERDLIYSQQIRLQQEFDEKNIANETLLNSNHEQARKLKSWDEEISRLRETHKSIAKAKLILAKKIKILDEEKITADMERDGLRVKYSLFNVLIN